MASRGPAVTQRELLMVEQEVGKIYNLFSELPPSSKSFMSLQRERHVEYLTRGLRMLPSSFASLDANCPWLCYWISYSISLLDESIEPEMKDDVINFLSCGQVASILNILDDELVKDVGCDILSCQTYEGGIAAEPGSEVLGGLWLVTMILINEFNLLDLPPLVDWLVCRQGVECGFQGRTNKLVDGCYSF